MKYRAQDYAQALVTTIERAPERGDEVVQRFVSLLARTGDIAREREVVRAVESLVRSRTGARRVVVESAHPLSQSAAARIGEMIEPNDTVEYLVKPQLLAGVRISFDDGTLIDASLSAKLKKLFQTTSSS
ncbi:MAG: F0F1 ATP synthase subunit delta [Candidatus Colwellbacteria bacterium]|nr:F0F1 ATP synthase subunit delta [Candidatus Colwellbacteria bacterium]